MGWGGGGDLSLFRWVLNSFIFLHCPPPLLFHGVNTTPSMVFTPVGDSLKSPETRKWGKRRETKEFHRGKGPNFAVTGGLIKKKRESLWVASGLHSNVANCDVEGRATFLMEHSLKPHYFSSSLYLMDPLQIHSQPKLRFSENF